MSEKRLNNCLLLHVHKEITDSLDQTLIAQEFISTNDERKKYLGNFQWMYNVTFVSMFFCARQSSLKKCGCTHWILIANTNWAPPFLGCCLLPCMVHTCICGLAPEYLTSTFKMNKSDILYLKTSQACEHSNPLKSSLVAILSQLVAL